MTIKYFSASQIQRFRRCPRSWWRAYVLGEREPETEAQRVGKQVHAEMEAWWLHGTEPAHRLAQGLRRAMPFVPGGDNVASSAVEADTESGGFQLAGLPMRGFVDLQVWSPEGGLTILDYKTTSGWQWAKTTDALRVDPQLNLYAAWAFYTYPELPEVTVGHLAVHKGTAEARWTAVARSRDDVRAYCTGIVETLRAMIAAAEQAEDEVTQHESACGDYGGCAYRAVCFPFASRHAVLVDPPAPAAAPAPTNTEDARARLAALRARRAERTTTPEARAQTAPEPAAAPQHVCAFVPPDAMPDLEPEPLDTRPVADVLPKGALAGAAARGIHTVSDLQTFLAHGGLLADIKGLGPSAAPKVGGELATISRLWPSDRLRLRRALDLYLNSPDASPELAPTIRNLRGVI